MPRPNGLKIQGWCADYDKWRIQRLMELGLETSESNFVARVVREWLDAHVDDHAQVGITPEAYLREKRRAGEAKLIRFDRLDQGDPEGSVKAKTRQS